MIVVTGAAGFIGSMVVAALNAGGEHGIVAVDTLGALGKFKNLRTRSLIDIIGPEALLEGLTMGSIKPTAIVHMGAISDTLELDGDRLLEMNTHYTRRLAEYCVRHGVRFIYASSASVYGDGALGFGDSDAVTPMLMPMNAYGFSKWLFDAEAIRKGWTDKIAGLRFFNVFGPNEYHKGRGASVVWHSYCQIRDTDGIRLFQSHRDGIADGEQKRDFVYVNDVVDVILWLLKESSVSGIFNVGSGKARSFNDLANAIFTALGMGPRIEYIPTPETIRDHYQYFTEADMSRLRAAGYTREFRPLEDTVKDYVQGYLMKPNPYA
jgi:ADP-L-glycero-D-manno-heptose 6-epimerase